MSVVLTRSRLSNTLTCYWNYALSLFGLVRISHMPLFVSVEPAAVCQLRCPACPVGMRNHQSHPTTPSRMSREVWQRTLREVAPYAHTMQFYFQGEPLLNKDLPRMIREAHEAGLYTIVSTNAQAMTESMAHELVAAGLDRIIVSMDGLTQETYEAYRVGGEVAQCKQALRWLHDAKQSAMPHSAMMIELQCLRLKSNAQEWNEMKWIYKRLGADRLVFKTAQLYDYRNGHPLMLEGRWSRYEKDADGLYHRKRLPKRCLRVWSGCVVTTTGEVLPCCYDKSHTHAYGNIMNAPIRELFGNEKALAFRREAIQEKPIICQECWR